MKIIVKASNNKDINFQSWEVWVQDLSVLKADI